MCALGTHALCVVQGEEEVMFLDYRKELKVLIDNIAMLVSLHDNTRVCKFRGGIVENMWEPMVNTCNYILTHTYILYPPYHVYSLKESLLLKMSWQ